jgi:hypothetical protein
MKKLMLVVLLAGFSFYASAQVQFALGLKAGPNFSSINTDASAGENYKSRTGFHGGAFALIKLTKIGIQPEILFSQQGSDVKINNQNFESNFSYLNVPIMVKLYLAAGLNIQAGPQFGFVTSAESPIVDQLSPSGYTTADIKDKAKSSDIGASFGLGWDLPFGLTIDARYNMGLSKMFENDNALPESTQDARNQVFQISLGYKLIKLGK